MSLLHRFPLKHPKSKNICLQQYKRMESVILQHASIFFIRYSEFNPVCEAVVLLLRASSSKFISLKRLHVCPKVRLSQAKLPRIQIQ